MMVILGLYFHQLKCVEYKCCLLLVYCFALYFDVLGE